MEHPTLSKLPTPTSSVPAQRTERKGMPLLLDATLNCECEFLRLYDIISSQLQWDSEL